MTKSFRIWFVILLTLVVISAESKQMTGSESDSDSTSVELEPQKFLNELKRWINPYGSYRVYFGMNSNGYFGMSDNASRFGIEGGIPIHEKYDLEVFAVAEFGTNLVDRDEFIVFRADPGAEVTEEGNAVYSRLGFVGLRTHYLSFSVGKQWSVYYDVAEYTDQFYAFGADGAVTFNMESDGGISGTGRANRLFLLRSNFNSPIKFGIQAQTRYITDNSKQFADTWGASLRYEPEYGISIGIAFNIVRDGVEDPKFNQPKTGDKSIITAISYKKNRLHLSYSLSLFENHEMLRINDSTRYFFSGYGMELFAGYYLSKSERWRVATGFNLIQPKRVVEVGKFRLLYFVAECSYTFGTASHIFTTVKVNRSSDIFGALDTTSVFAMGLRFSFGY